jgi:CRISPR/Cas system-associated exonuclease Cas4 (RecB family)
MNNFSPNMLKTFDECQMKFFLKYVEKISIPQSAKFFEKGKKVHALANYYLKGADISKMEKVLTADEKAAWENLKSSKYFKFNVIGTEYNLSCRVGGAEESYWIGGRLDALMLDNQSPPCHAELISASSQLSNTDKILKQVQDDAVVLNLSTDFYILDYKTGNIPRNPEFDFQTIVYLLAADKFLNSKKIPCNSLQFVYLGLKDNVEKSVLLDESLKKKYEEKIVSVCKNIDLATISSVFSKNKESCNNCEYNKICS